MDDRRVHVPGPLLWLLLLLLLLFVLHCQYCSFFSRAELALTKVASMDLSVRRALFTPDPTPAPATTCTLV
jgi:hypothetical protein